MTFRRKEKAPAHGWGLFNALFGQKKDMDYFWATEARP
jgi:hypothetical protein